MSEGQPINPVANMTRDQILNLADQEDKDITERHKKERADTSARIKAEQEAHWTRQKYLKALANVAPVEIIPKGE